MTSSNIDRVIHNKDFFISMPVLENVHVQLSEVLEVRGLPLSEDELWALLCLTLESVQDLFLRGAAFKDSTPLYLLNPVALQCTSSGKVLISKSSPVDIGQEYLAPELVNCNNLCSDQDLGKVYVYSLGKTLQFAVENECEYFNQSNWFSPLFVNTLHSMVQDDPRLRISLQGLSKVCARYTSSLPNEQTHTSFIVQLHQEVLGNLPETEILNQVDKDFAEENARMSFSLSHSADCSQNRKDTIESIDDGIYGRRLDYRCKTENINNSGGDSKRPNPRERWRRAFTQIAQHRKQALNQLDNSSSILDNCTSRSSAFKVYQELAERRRMLELLRSNIDAGHSAVKDIEKGLKPKTLAELVLLLKNNPIKTDSPAPSADSNLSNPCNKRLKSASRSNSFTSHKHSSSFEFYSLQTTNATPFKNIPGDFCGPEFVFNRTVPPSQLNLCSARKLQTESPREPPCNLTIVLVTGQRLSVTCDPNISGTTLFHAIAHHVMLLEHYLFGLALSRDGEFVFLDGRQRLHKVLSYLSPFKITETKALTLHLRIKYYLMDINLIKHKATRHLYYLQTRCDCLESRFRCSKDATTLLAGLALQAEFEDFVPREEYFILEDYVPESFLQTFGREESTKQLTNQHAKHTGISKDMAELQFVQKVCELPEYGYHFHKVFQDKHDINSEVWLSINAQGIGVLEENKGQERSKVQSYLWPEIEKLSFTKKSFNITPKTTSLTGKSVKYTFHTTDGFKSRYLFNMAVGHHQFFVKLKSGANASEIIMEDIELGNGISRNPQDSSALMDTDEEVECTFGSSLDSSGSWLSSVRAKYLDKMNAFSSGRIRKLSSFSDKRLSSPMVRKRTSDQRNQTERRRRTLDSVDVSAVQCDEVSSSGSKIRPLPFTAYQREVLRGAVDPVKTPDQGLKSSEDSEDISEAELRWVTLRKIPQQGFGLVLTCGNTLDTVISGTFIESVHSHQPQAHCLEPGDKVIWLNGQNVENKNYLEVAALLLQSGSACLGLQRPKRTAAEATAQQSLRESDSKEEGKFTSGPSPRSLDSLSSPESYGTMEFSFFNEDDSQPPQPRPRRKKSAKSPKSPSEGLLPGPSDVSGAADDISRRANEALTLNGSDRPLVTVPRVNLKPRDANECAGAVTANPEEFHGNVVGEIPQFSSVNSHASQSSADDFQKHGASSEYSERCFGYTTFEKCAGSSSASSQSKYYFGNERETSPTDPETDFENKIPRKCETTSKRVFESDKFVTAESSAETKYCYDQPVSKKFEPVRDLASEESLQSAESSGKCAVGFRTSGKCLEFSGKIGASDGNEGRRHIGEESDRDETGGPLDFTGLCDSHTLGEWTLKPGVADQMLSTKTRDDLHFWKPDSGNDSSNVVPDVKIGDGTEEDDDWDSVVEVKEQPEVNPETEVTLFAVSLTKQEGSFGFRVTERYQFGEDYERGIFVHSLIPGGSAEKDATIQAGDKLIRINGVQTEPLSYQESVGLLKKCPATCELHFARRPADAVPAEPDAGREPADGGPPPPAPMIAKWGRLGSRTSLSSLPGEQDAPDGRPGYGRSVSQISLPPIHLPTVQARSRSSSLSSDVLGTPHLPNGHDSPRNFPDLPSPELSPEQSSTFPRKSKSKSPTVFDDSLSDDVFNGSSDTSSQQRVYYRSVSAPLLAVPKTGTSRSSNSPSSLHRETLGVVLEDYSLDRFDNVFAHEDSLERDYPMSKTASKYAVLKSGSSLMKWNGTLEQEERDSSPAVTPDTDDERPPLVVRKKRAGLLDRPSDVYKYLTPGNTFEMQLQKTSRGLGLGIFGGSDLERLGPVCQLVRVRKLYPLQPALESGKLAVGDVILQVNGQTTMGLTHTEALELLRVAPTNVILKIYRPNAAVMPPVSFYIKDVSPNSSFLISPPGSACNTLSRPKSSSQEYETTLLKKEGSLGFSIVRHERLHSDDAHPTGIYVKALIREPALSHQKIRPGDRILMVNGEDISGMSHAEAVSFLRQASETVTLRLSPNNDLMWPQCLEDDPNKPAKPLRKEAIDMLSNRAKQKEGKTSPRRLKLKRTGSESPSSSDDLSEGNLSPQLVLSPNSETETPSEGLLRSLRPKSLDGLSFNEKKQPFDGMERTNNDLSFQRQGSVLEPAGKDLGTEGAGLLKWRGATLHSNGEGTSPSSGSIDLSGLQVSRSDMDSTPTPSPVPMPPQRIQSLPFEEESLTNRNGHLKSNKDQITQVVKVYVEMDRGWHGRLGFSLSDILPNEKPNPLSHYTSPVVRAVHPGSVAYKDGRIRVGDRLVMVNGESMVDRPAAEVIDLLRKTRGKMRMDLLRVQQECDTTSHSSVGSS